MSLVKWNDGYLVGVAMIDDHHRHLVDLLNQTYEAVVKNKSKAEMEKIFSELTDYCRYHFSAEEALMREAKYPQLEKHAAIHGSFAQEINVFQDDFARGNALIKVGVLNFLKDWLIDHILRLDKELGACNGKVSGDKGLA